MKTRPLMMICVVAVTAALIYAILQLPDAIGRGVQAAAPALVGSVEDRLMSTVQEAIKSPEVMDQINNSIQTASTQMGDRLLTELPTAIRDAIVQMLTLSTPETQAFAQNLRNEAAAALPNRKDIETLSGQILREEIDKRLGNLKLDQKTIVELAMQVIERRLLGSATTTTSSNVTLSPTATPSPTLYPTPYPTPRPTLNQPTATPSISRAPVAVPTPSSTPRPSATPTRTPVPSRAPSPTPTPQPTESANQQPWLPLVPRATSPTPTPVSER